MIVTKIIHIMKHPRYINFINVSVAHLEKSTVLDELKLEILKYGYKSIIVGLDYIKPKLKLIIEENNQVIKCQLQEEFSELGKKLEEMIKQEIKNIPLDKFMEHFNNIIPTIDKTDHKINEILLNNNLIVFINQIKTDKDSEPTKILLDKIIKIILVLYQMKIENGHEFKADSLDTIMREFREIIKGQFERVFEIEAATTPMKEKINEEFDFCFQNQIKSDLDLKILKIRVSVALETLIKIRKFLIDVYNTLPDKIKTEQKQNPKRSKTETNRIVMRKYNKIMVNSYTMLQKQKRRTINEKIKSMIKIEKKEISKNFKNLTSIEPNSLEDCIITWISHGVWIVDEKSDDIYELGKIIITNESYV